MKSYGLCLPLTYFTWHNTFRAHLCYHKWQNFILYYAWVVFLCVCVVWCFCGHRNCSGRLMKRQLEKSEDKPTPVWRNVCLCRKGTRWNQQTPPKLCGCASQIRGHALLFPGGKQTPQKGKLLASLHRPKTIKGLPPPTNVKWVLRPMALGNCHMKWITWLCAGVGVHWEPLQQSPAARTSWGPRGLQDMIQRPCSFPGHANLTLLPGEQTTEGGFRSALGMPGLPGKPAELGVHAGISGLLWL